MTLALSVGGLAGLVLCVFAYAAAVDAFLRLRRTARGALRPGFAPPVSIVKPLRGLDEGLEENLESFYRLDYPSFELVFSFASAQDPACAMARRVADRHPGIRSTFVMDAREPGGNAKVNRLHAALRFARHRLLLFSDGNVRVRPDFLARAASFFEDPDVGLVSHLFRAEGAIRVGSRLESLYLNGCLQPGTALVAGVLGMPCVVGKSILVSRPVLESAGGIEALRDHLAEDYLLGRAVRRSGSRVVLSADVLETREVRKPLRGVWDRHRRWAMMRRRLGGPLYAGELLTSALPWFLLTLLSPSPAIRAAGILLLAMRWGGEAAFAARSGAPLGARDAVLLPVRDGGAAAVFVAGLIGRRLAWRGRPMVIGKETRILRAA